MHRREPQDLEPIEHIHLSWSLEPHSNGIGKSTPQQPLSPPTPRYGAATLQRDRQWQDGLLICLARSVRASTHLLLSEPFRNGAIYRELVGRQ